MGNKEIEMKRTAVCELLFVCMCSCLFSQETIQAQKELITKLKLGTSDLELEYQSNEEGFYSPCGPMIDEKGQILLYPEAGEGAYHSLIQINRKGTVSKRELFPIMKEWNGTTTLQFASQEGYIQLNNVCIVLSENGYGSAFYPHEIADIPVTNEARYYPLPFGSYMESDSPPFVYSTEAKNGTAVRVRNVDETREWLPKQPGGFSIGDDGLLYRNGMVWSAVKPKGKWEWSNYIGKLASGHNIFANGWRAQEKELAIADSKGTIELVVTIPWAAENNPAEKFNMFNYGVGPWGELYYLIPPQSMLESNIDKYGGYVYTIKQNEKIKDPAELVVVRNYLKYFGRLNDGGVRLRKGPSAADEILGTYPAKTGFRILEKGTAEETIGGKKSVWYKVRLLDGTEGWFFGAYVKNLYDGPDGNPPPWPNVADW